MKISRQAKQTNRTFLVLFVWLSNMSVWISLGDVCVCVSLCVLHTHQHICWHFSVSFKIVCSVKKHAQRISLLDNPTHANTPCIYKFKQAITIKQEIDNSYFEAFVCVFFTQITVELIVFLWCHILSKTVLFIKLIARIVCLQKSM